MDTKSYSLSVNGKNREKFELLYSMLIEYNEKYNLTAITDKREVFLKHFLDSVVGEAYFKKGAKVIEVGSGAGFPSIPLKIVRKDLNFTLVESVGKKCEYLNAVVEKFGLKGVEVINSRCEVLGQDKNYRRQYDVVTARAVAKMNTLCEYCLPFLKIGGLFVAYKGNADKELEEAKKAIKVLGGKIKEVEKFTLPNGDARTLIVIEKVSHTPLKYPRGQGLEKKEPII